MSVFYDKSCLFNSYLLNTYSTLGTKVGPEENSSEPKNDSYSFKDLEFQMGVGNKGTNKRTYDGWINGWVNGWIYIGKYQRMITSLLELKQLINVHND